MTQIYLTKRFRFLIPMASNFGALSFHPVSHCRSSRPLSSLVCFSKRESHKENDNHAKVYPKRRTTLLSVALYPFLAVVSGSDDAKTVLNSVLSAYGLPTLKASRGYKIYDQFEDDYYFEYPKSWVVVPNRLRAGVYISNYQTADKVTVESFPLSEISADGDRTIALISRAVEKSISPGERMQNDRLEMPSLDSIKYQKRIVDEQEYVFIQFPSSTITRSGYQVRRKNTGVAAIRKDMGIVLCASSRSENATPEKEDVLQHVVESFRLR